MLKLPRYLNEREVSRITGLSLSTLRNDRWRGRNIPFYRLGRSVRYRADDVVKWVEARKIRTQ